MEMEAQRGQVIPSDPTAKMLLADPQMGLDMGGGGWNGQSESPGSVFKPFMLCVPLTTTSPSGAFCRLCVSGCHPMDVPAWTGINKLVTYNGRSIKIHGEELTKIRKRCIWRNSLGKKE